MEYKIEILPVAGRIFLIPNVYFCSSQHIEHYAEEVREDAEDDEYMENRVHISMLYSDPVEYRAECVEHTACDEQATSMTTASPPPTMCVTMLNISSPRV